MPREIIKVTREDDDSFGIYLDGELWEKYSEEELRHPGTLWVKLGRAVQEITNRRLVTGQLPAAGGR